MNQYPELNPVEKSKLMRGFCPDCGLGDKWQPGPSAGQCQNWRCGNCGSEFNLTPMVVFMERISEPKPDEKQRKVTE